MTLTTRTMPVLAVALTVALPAPRAWAEDAPQSRQEDREFARQVERQVERQLDDTRDEIRRLEREAARLDSARTREMIEAAGAAVQALALEAGALAGRFASGIADEMIRGFARDAEVFEQGGRGARGPEISERFSQTFQVRGGAALELNNLAGDVLVTGRPGDTLTVDGVKRVWLRGGTPGQGDLDALRVEMRQQGNRVDIRTEYPRDNRRGGSVDFTIGVPQGASVDIHTVSGDIRLTNVEGELRAESVSGDVAATGARRLGLLKAVSGDVTIVDADLDGAASAATVSGDIEARNLRARSVELGTVSGDVQLQGVRADGLDIDSVSGDITLRGTLVRMGRYRFNTHSGDIDLLLGDDTGFDLSASTFSGSIVSDYPLSLRGRDDNRVLGQEVRGSFGDASAVLTLRSFSGTIRIREE